MKPDGYLAVTEAFWFTGELPMKQTGNQAAIEFVNSKRHEAHLYRKYKAFYGYVFYIGTKVV